MTVLTNKELADIYAEKKGMGKGEAAKFLADVFETLGNISVEYASGFKLGDIGTLEVNLVEAKDHNRTNPQTKEKFVQHVPEHFAPKFKFGKGVNSVKTRLVDVETK